MITASTATRLREAASAFVACLEREEMRAARGAGQTTPEAAKRQRELMAAVEEALEGTAMNGFYWRGRLFLRVAPGRVVGVREETVFELAEETA